jgi:uncharacterized protein involved in outer membrane biogenesis
MDRLKRILRSKRFLIPVGLVLAYTLAGFFLVPALVRHYVPRLLEEKLQRPAAIGTVRFNPFIFTFEANEFRLNEPDGTPVVAFQRFFADFELKSLFNWAWTFRTVALEAPLVNAVVAPDGVLNLAQLAPRDPAGAPPPSQPGEPPRLIFEEVTIEQGEIDFTDRRQAEPASIVFKPLQLAVTHLTTLPRQEGAQAITAATRDGEVLRWTGNISLNPMVSKGKLEFEKFRAATLWKFARDALNLEPPAGTISVTADYALDLSAEEPQAVLSNLALVLSGLALKLHGAEAPFLELPDAHVTGVGVDLARQVVELARVAVQGGHARLRVDEGGVLNLQRAARHSEPAAPAAAPGRSKAQGKPWKVALKEFSFGGFAVDYEDASRSPGLKAGIETLGVRLNALAEAGSGPTAVKVADMAVAVKGLQARFAGTTDIPLRIESVALEGGEYDLGTNSLTLSRLAVEGGAVDLRRDADGALNLALLFAPPQTGAIAREREAAAAEGRPFQFVAQAIAVTGLQASVSDLGAKPDGPLINLKDIAVTLNDVDGKSPMAFDAALALAEGGRIRAAGTFAPQVPSVEAEIQVSEFALAPFQPYVDRALAVTLTSGAFSLKGTLRHGVQPSGVRTAFQGGFKLDELRLVEPGGKDTLVGWKSLQTDQLTLELEPDRLEIGDLKIVRPAGKFIIAKDHSINVAKVVRTDPGVKKTPAAPGPGPADPFPYRVRRVLVSEGEVDFADLSLITPFGTRIHQLKGIVAGVSSARNARAQVKLDGRVDNYGTAKIDGELNTADPKIYTNIGVAFRNVEMSRLTPYSGKFAGRKIDSGKLTVDLKYRIDRSRLAGDNKLVVERLKLGEKVKSPDAVDLPLDLAVALLSDSDGVIDLGLPVSGNLDSPEFSYWGLIGKAFVNLLTKVVTSPFRALGSLLPDGGEEGFNTVAFEAGRPELPPPEREKLALLAGALQKRPQLKLSIQGRYQPEADRTELQAIAVRRALAARLGRAPGTGDDEPVDFGNPETTKAIEALFTQRLGADALKALKADAAADRAKAKKEAAAVKAAGASPSAVENDPGEFMKSLMTRLERAEPVDDAALARLADERAQAVMAEVRDVGRIAPERLQALPPAAAEKADEPASALLNLEAAR